MLQFEVENENDEKKCDEEKIKNVKNRKRVRRRRRCNEVMNANNDKKKNKK